MILIIGDKNELATNNNLGSCTFISCQCINKWNYNFYNYKKG